jgi:two-component system response regulator AtoC
MKALVDDIERVAQSDASVLVRGETGSGKELVARALHAASERRAGPFVAINCAALPPQLLESELFGHVRGAFTGAVRDSPGLMQRADGGTILLDEIAELPLELQAKLLRVLEERSVIPVGGRDPVPVDVRFVSATHRSLRDAVAQGRFRADLMYRIRVVPLFLPSLRERKGDVPLIVAHLVARFNERGKRHVEHVTQGALAALDAYDWPGNVRELSNAIEYSFAIGRGPVITEAELPPEIVHGEQAQGHDEGAHNVSELPPITATTLDPAARRILRALERAGGHKRRAAESLGMSRTTFWRKLRELGLES